MSSNFLGLEERYKNISHLNHSIKLFLVSLLFHSLFVLSPLHEISRFDLDSGIYIELGKNIAHFGSFFLNDNVFFVVEGGKPTLFWTPVYPLLISLFEYFNLNSRTFIIWLQVILVSSLVFPTISIFENFSLNKSKKAIVIFLLSFYPMHFLLTCQVMSESIAVFFVYWIIAIATKKNLKLTDYVFLGIFSGLLILTRPEYLLISGIIYTWVFLKNIKKKIPVSKCIFSFCICLIILSPWFIRNKLTFNSWKFTTRASYSLVYQNIIYQKIINSEIVDQNEYFDELPQIKGEINRAKLLQDSAFSYFKNHPIITLKLSIKRIISSITPSVFKDFVYTFFLKKRITDNSKIKIPRINIFFSDLYIMSMYALIILIFFQIRAQKIKPNFKSLFIPFTSSHLLVFLFFCQLIIFSLSVYTSYQRSILEPFWLLILFKIYYDIKRVRHDEN